MPNPKGHELPIKSKFLVFDHDASGDVYIFNKRFNDLIGFINPQKHFIPEKNTSWTERDLKDILKCIEYLKKGDIK